VLRQALRARLRSEVCASFMNTPRICGAGPDAAGNPATRAADDKPGQHGTLTTFAA